MSQHSIILTGKLQDRTVVRLMREVSQKFEVDDPVFQGFRTELPIDRIEESQIYLVDNASCTLKYSGNPVYFYFRRGRSADDNNINVRSASAFEDEIILSGKGSLSADEYLMLQEVIQKHIKQVDNAAINEKAQGAFEVLQSEISALNELQKSMIEEQVKIRRTNEEDLQSRIRAVDEHATNQETELARKYNEQAALNEAELAELARLKKELDDRDHMHVRRELREKITGDINERVSQSLVPKKTGSLGWWVFALSLFCAFVSGTFAYMSYGALMSVAGWENVVSSDNAAEVAATSSNGVSGAHLYLMIARTSIASIATLGFLVYALSWLRGMYQRNLQLSNDLQQYALDINRASWTIETIMEMTTKEGRVLPDQWIEGACRGLFEKHDAQSNDPTAMDALGALLNVTGRLEVGPDGNKLEFGKKELQKAAK